MKSLLIYLFFMVIYTEHLQGQSLTKAPPSFPYKDTLAIPIDFKESKVKITIDIQQRKISCISTIKFYSQEEGYPIFDLVPDMESVQLNGQTLSIPNEVDLYHMEDITSFRILKRKVASQSNNILVIHHSFPMDQAEFEGDKVELGFWMADGKPGGRNFLEKYLVSNLEFDQFKLSIELKIVDSQTTHKLITNGKETSEGLNSWKIEFPKHYTASSFYLHLLPPGKYSFINENIRLLNKDVTLISYGIEGRNVDLQEVVDYSKVKLVELVNLYGQYSYDKIIMHTSFYHSGMEHTGAFVGPPNSTNHELAHFWFGRGVLPANGNAGWLDEAMVMWRQKRFPRRDTLSRSRPHNLANHSPYQRETVKESYTIGSEVLAYIDLKLHENNQISLKEILRLWYELYNQKIVTSDDFQEFLQQKSNMDFEDLFQKHVYGQQ